MSESKLRQPLQPERVAALVITYFPDLGLAERLDRLLEQFPRVLVVDNGSAEAGLRQLEGHARRAGFGLVRNEANLGIAAALNQGIRRLAEEGFGWVVTFDQDSTICPGFLLAMLATLNAQPDPKQIALIGANRIDPDNDIEHRWVRPHRIPPFFERVPCAQATSGVTLVITSGAFTNVELFRELGGFREDLFIDMVDNEYCLRVTTRGYKVLVSCEASLLHKVGDKTRSSKVGVGISATHHSPLRKYYLFRNSIPVMWAYGRIQPHWLIYHLLALSEMILGIVFLETHKGTKLKACALGIIDGLAGQNGPSRRTWGQTATVNPK